MGVLGAADCGPVEPRDPDEKADGGAVDTPVASPDPEDDREGVAVWEAPLTRAPRCRGLPWRGDDGQPQRGGGPTYHLPLTTLTGPTHWVKTQLWT